MPTSAVVADTHVHLYPCHAIGAAFDAAARNLSALSPGARRLIFLTEAHGCHAFRDLASGALTVPGRAVRSSPEAGALLVGEGHEEVYVLAGRQIVARERIEVLALTGDVEIPDGLPMARLLGAVGEAGGIPVVAWAPGKWLFGRGRVVRDLVAGHGPGAFLLGDTTLRPTLWPEPRLMRAGRRKGFGVVAGTDPLPLAGEERWIGRYGVHAESGFDPAEPVTSARRVLRGPLRIVGTRAGPAEVIRRLAVHFRHRRP